MDRKSQIAYLGELAARVREIADSPKNHGAIKRWHDLNSKRKPDRLPVWLRPVTGWRELLPKEQLKCMDKDLIPIETSFRQQMIKDDIGDDTPFYPWYGVQAVFDSSYRYVSKVGSSIFPTGSSDYKVIFDYKDLDELEIPEFSYNESKTNEKLDFINSIVGDSLPARLVCSNPPFSATFGGDLIRFRGLMGLMTDIMDYPDELHRLAAYFRDCTLAAIDAYEGSGLVTPNIFEPMICSEGFGEKTNGAYTFKNCYCMANSQEFDQISPEMWEEFLLDYQKPVFERFGRICYGCCENLTHKIDGVLSVPNLHIFVCSAWTDLAKVAEKVRGEHVIMWRQKASDVFFTEDLSVLRNRFAEGLKTLEGCYPQVVLREIETLGPYKNRIYDYTKMVIEEAAKF